MNELSIKYCAPFCRADLRASFHSVWDIWFDPSTSVSVSVFRLGSWNYLPLVILCPVVEKQQLKIHLKSGPCSLIGKIFFGSSTNIHAIYVVCRLFIRRQLTLYIASAVKSNVSTRKGRYQSFFYFTVIHMWEWIKWKGRTPTLETTRGTSPSLCEK